MLLHFFPSTDLDILQPSPWISSVCSWEIKQGKPLAWREACTVMSVPYIFIYSLWSTINPLFLLQHQQQPEAPPSYFFHANRGCQTIYTHTQASSRTWNKMCSCMFAREWSLSFPRVRFMILSHCTPTPSQIFQSRSGYNVEGSQCLRVFSMSRNVWCHSTKTKGQSRKVRHLSIVTLRHVAPNPI